MQRPHRFVRLFGQVMLALILALLFVIAASHFGWHLVREAGGAMPS